jgi:transglutaminase-like putative cysteine protease
MAMSGSKSYGWLVLQAWLLLGAAVAFAVSVQSPALPVVTGLLLAVSFAKRRTLPHTVRSWVWTLVGCAGFCLVLASPEPSDTVRFSFMASHRFCPVLLGIGVAMTFFEQRAANLGAQATCAFIAVVLAGGNDAEGIDLAAVRRAQGCVMMAMLFPLGALIQRAAVGVPAPAISRTRRRSVLGRLPAVVVTVLLAAGLFAFVQVRVFGWSDVLSTYLTEWVQNAASRRAGRQLPMADVRKPPPAKKGRDAVVLRVWTTRAPGYLRTVAYPIYGRGIWRAMRASRSMPETEAPVDVAPARLFARPDWSVPADDAALTTWRVQPTRAFGGAYLPLPGTAGPVEIVADNAVCDRDGSVRVEAWVRSSGFRVRLPAQRANPAYARQLDRASEDEAAGGDDPYLVVPAGVATGLSERLAQWQVPPAGAPARVLIEAVTLGLQTNQTYRLGVSLRSDRDPVLQFLEGRQGHCELFASAATLMLRQRGVRARYVTGYICDEPHPSWRYWVARESAAHAWAEAYVPETARWELVEATPSDGRPSGVGKFGRWERRWDPLLAALRQAWGALRSGAAVQGLRQRVAMGVIWLIDHAVAALATVLILSGTWVTWRVVRDRRTTPAQRRRLNALRHRIDRRLAAAGSPRPWHCTLREGVLRATQLEPADRQALLDDVAAWERERYG